MYKVINVATLSKTVKNYRKTMILRKKTQTAPQSSSSSLADEENEVKGAFKIQLCYAENVKPVTTSGLANAYVTVRVPDGTVVPPPDPDDLSSANTNTSAGAVILTGTACEMARTRAIYDTVNPTWDETFTLLLPPVTRLELGIYSKNMITSDELCGRATLDLGLKTRLRRKLNDHITHDVFVETEPQGRLLLRITMEGEEEDVEFWFRKSKERLGRARDDFLRALCSKVCHYYLLFAEVIHYSVLYSNSYLLTSKK